MQRRALHRLHGVDYLIAIGLSAWLIGCEANGPQAASEDSGAGPRASMLDPAIADTLQAEVALTAAWVATLTPPVSLTSTSTPAVAMTILTGTPLEDRRGDCTAPDGFVIQVRQGFCMAVPPAWAILNVDGGMASALKTTPGQAISLQPDWADSTAVCYLLAYISSETSLAAHLQPRHDEFASRSDLKTLSPIGVASMGDLGLVGFTWEDASGSRGGIYAGMVGANRLAHISEGGVNCPLDRLLPVLESLRFF